MTPRLHQYWRALANGERTTIPDRLLLALLIPLSLVYASVQRLRAAMYLTGIFQTRRLPRPVISVGNLTVGGTGKTPVTAYIARLLLNQGYRVVVISRGYGGTLEGRVAIVSDGISIMLSPKECGDEPHLLASKIPGLIVVTGSDRYKAGMLAMARFTPDIFLLDDGFQHLGLHRDLNILLSDYSHPFGNDWTLPAGALREACSSARRANLLIQTRCPDNPAPAAILPGVPCCNAQHSLADITPLDGGEPLGPDTLSNLKLLAFAGIAAPQDFFDGLRERGLNLVATISLPDHVNFNDRRIDEIRQTMLASGADYAITTEKDGVKLRQLSIKFADRILLAQLDLTFSDPAPLTTALFNLLQK